MNVNNRSVEHILSSELSLPVKQVEAFVTLYDDGNTVPFIARYRKQATSGLDDIQLRALETRLIYLRELDVRRQTILKRLAELEKLDTPLKKQIQSCVNKTALELLYAPFKSKRVSKGALAIAAGIEPLADQLWFNHDADHEQLARRFINIEQGFTDTKSVLSAASAIVSDRLSSDPALLDKLRNYLLKNALIICKLVKSKQDQAAKFKDYFDYREGLNRIAAHRLLAILRGKSEGFLKVKIDIETGQKNAERACAEEIIANHLGFSLNRLPAASWRVQVLQKSWKSKLSVTLESQIISALKEKAHDSAIDVFAGNIKDLLMAAPAGRKVVLGLDPGFRTGCKIAVVDPTGKLLDYATIYPHPPGAKMQQAEKTLSNLLTRYQVDLIAIGNGTASRETELFVRDCLSKQTAEITHLIVSEAGASVYSASELASAEFPQLDVVIRGAISIARRLQDPLSELVKIEPAAIGVGLYQHDLNQTQLNKRLQAVVEDCVNAVGVDLNSASVSLLRFVAGLNPGIARNIVAYRDSNGLFKSRQTLNKVARLGDKAFQQCAGFLRISDGHNPLDNSAVHPESYTLVNALAQQLNLSISELISNPVRLNKVEISPSLIDKFGLVTIQEVIKELAKPWRDPRPVFKTVRYKQGINKIDDLDIDLVLQGVITNVTSFGAFVDIGVHQDGLVHISELADKFVRDPLLVVKVGQIVQVKVLDVDKKRNRIALTMRL